MLSAGRVVKDAPQGRLKAMSPQNVKKFLYILCVSLRSSALQGIFHAEDAEVRGERRDKPLYRDVLYWMILTVSSATRP